MKLYVDDTRVRGTFGGGNICLRENIRGRETFNWTRKRKSYGAYRGGGKYLGGKNHIVYENIWGGNHMGNEIDMGPRGKHLGPPGEAEIIWDENIWGRGTPG